MTQLFSSASNRLTLPKPADRFTLGTGALAVSPFCLGIVGDPEIVPAAFDAGINFFFVSGDLHWPLYEKLRRGLELLFARGKSVRDQVVVAAVSYLDLPLFQAMQFHEIIDAVKGLDRVDLLTVGAIYSVTDLQARAAATRRVASTFYLGAQAVGASFHDRKAALLSANAHALDVHFIRYNTSHPGARQDFFPLLQPGRSALIFNFKSMMSLVQPRRFRELGLEGRCWQPKPTDYYRFVLTPPGMDGVLCSLNTLQELRELTDAMQQSPLTPEEERYMVWLSSIGSRRMFE